LLVLCGVRCDANEGRNGGCKWMGRGGEEGMEGLGCGLVVNNSKIPIKAEMVG